MKRTLFLAAASFLICCIHSHANTLSYYTDGCAEYITEVQHVPSQFRIIYRCCGSTCFQETAWTTLDGPLLLCGSTFNPSNGGSADVHFDSQGNALVAVAPGHGGIIAYDPEGICHSFTPNSGDITVVPYQLLSSGLH
jgi:hypothetical protein